MTCAILIKSFSRDFEWLSFALRSIQRFATGFSEIVVVVPKGEVPPTGTMENVFYVEETGAPYLFQQNLKLHADAFTDSDYTLYLDSDCIFTRPITPQDAINKDGMVRWLYTPYASLNDGNAMAWRAVVQKALKQDVEFEFMRRHPFCVPRWALEEMRQWFWREHGMSLERYIMSQPGNECSEFNFMGAWLWLHRQPFVEWINTDENMGIPFVHQSWSHDPLTDDIRANLEAALK